MLGGAAALTAAAAATTQPPTATSSSSAAAAADGYPQQGGAGASGYSLESLPKLPPHRPISARTDLQHNHGEFDTAALAHLHLHEYSCHTPAPAITNPH